jgi:arylsulfatase A-like enzyme
MKAVVFVSDSLRADHVGPDLTPAVERLADDGRRFKQAFSQAYWTASAAPSLLY